eukprot:812409-Amphidinium_carterae.1
MRVAAKSTKTSRKTKTLALLFLSRHAGAMPWPQLWLPRLPQLMRGVQIDETSRTQVFWSIRNLSKRHSNNDSLESQ